MNVYVLSHNGIGDNFFMIGALNFLDKFYDNVFLICKARNNKHIAPFLISPSVNTVPLLLDARDGFNERENLTKFFNSNKHNHEYDLFVCGGHKSTFKSRITNKEFLNCKKLDESYTIGYDTLNCKNYKFIKNFYNDMGLNLTHFYEFWHVSSTEESIRLFKLIDKYYIVFIQYKSSDNKVLNITNLVNKYINKSGTILICNDKNLYEGGDQTNEKYKIAKLFVYNKFINYIDTIKNSDEIYIIDSSFTGIVLPLLKTNRLKAKIVRIIRRNIKKCVLLPTPTPKIKP